MNSSVVKFYDGGHILITGATGFMGKVVIEKLLRDCHGVEQLYLLIRVKRGKEPNARLKDLFDDPVFQVLKTECPDYLRKVTVLAGDCSSPELGLSENVRNHLSGVLTHVFHGAATVRFDEQIRQAISVNVRGVIEMMKFCQTCTKLKSVMHTSTAYSNCPILDIEEKFYPAPMTGECAVKLLECFDDEKLDTITKTIIQPWPNTYSFSKAIAEEVVQKLGAGLPIGVFRPSTVVSTASDPIPGWIDNYFGPIGVVAGVGAGLMRVLYADKDIRANLVPVDMAVSALLCAAWEVGTNHSKKLQNKSVLVSKTMPEIPVYHYVASKQNELTWGRFLTCNFEHGMKIPTVKAIWYYTLTLTSIWPVYVLLTFLYHLLPAIVMDAGLLLAGKKPQMWKAYTKIHKFSGVLSFFSTKEWAFDEDRVNQMWSNLSPADKEIFKFDMKTLDWDQYFKNSVHGIRLYLFKDTPNTLGAGRRRMFYFKIAHRTLQTLLLALFCYALYSIFTGILTTQPDFFSQFTTGRWASRKTVVAL